MDQSYISGWQTSLIYRGLKRFMDLGFGVTMLIFFAPIMAIVAFFIWKQRDGEILFRQTRVGRNGKDFEICKFRTMCSSPAQAGNEVTAAGDSRITPLGKRLRDWKLDELPQLFNVIAGDMSLVGPRPQVPRFVNEFPEHQRPIILAVKPGITGPTQLAYRHEEDMLEDQPDPQAYYLSVLLPDKCARDVAYVQNPSLIQDFGLLFSTGWVVVRGVGLRINRKAVRAVQNATPTAEQPSGTPNRVN